MSTFAWIDYTIFALTLVFSTLIGLYYGCFGSKQATTSEYLTGEKKLKVIPIGVSLAVCRFSSGVLLGVPADVYRYGAAPFLALISNILSGTIVIFVYLPVFFKLQLTNMYEYLERRFDKRVRTFAFVLYLISEHLYLPLTIFGPAMALSAATGIKTFFLSLLFGGMCVFYTAIGGLKTVVWTDFLQFLIIIGSLISVFIVSTRNGFVSIWTTALDGGRLDIFDFDPDPTKRDTFWIIVIGLTVYNIFNMGVHQSAVQKFIAVPTFRDSVLSIVYCMISFSLVNIFCVFIGLGIYAKYSTCDPLTSKKMRRHDHLIPFYLMDAAGDLPGISGLFMAALLSAGLSTLSSSLNALSGVIYKEFVCRFSSKTKNKPHILKLIVLIEGLICICLTLLIEHLGDIFSMALTLYSIVNGPLLGLFTLGFLFPKANAKGAFCAIISGLIFMTFVVIPARYFEVQGYVRHPTKQLSTMGCDDINEFQNFTNFGTMGINGTSPILNRFEPPSIFRISFYYYLAAGTFVTILVGVIISWLTNKNDPSVDKSLISPVCHFLLPKDSLVEYNSVEPEPSQLEEMGKIGTK